MKWMTASAVIATLLTMSTALAADCSYCARLDKLNAEFSKVKPDPMDPKTIDAQTKLIDDAIDLADDVLKEKGKALAKDDVERLTTLIGKTLEYDNANLIAEELHEKLKPHWPKFKVEIKRQLSNGVIKPSEAERLENSFGVADHVLKHGSDKSGEQIDAEAAAAKKTKK